MDGKYCFLKKENIFDYEVLFNIQAGDPSERFPWTMNVKYYTRKVDEHYIVVAEKEFKTESNIDSKFSVIRVLHDKKTAKDYCLESSKKLAGGIARLLKCEVKDLTLEQTVKTT